MKKSLLAACTLAIMPLVHAAEPAPAPAAPTPAVYFITPADGATVTSPVTIKFGLTNFGVAPAGTDAPNTGHHHLLIDAPLPADLTMPIAKDANHVHFGGGQTETTIELTPGKHTLQLLMGNYMHIPHAAPIKSEMITITVK